MKSKTNIIFLLFLITFLSGCTSNEPYIEEIDDLVLIGDSTVYSPIGEDYIEQGVTLNGEREYASYETNVNINELGTYFLRYYNGEEFLIRTIIVTEGIKEEYLRFVDAFVQTKNYTYTSKVDIRYTLPNDSEEHLIYDYQTFSRYNDTFFGSIERESQNIEHYKETNYQYIDKDNKKIDVYRVDDNQYLYYQKSYYNRPLSLFTEFNLSGTNYVTKEIVNQKTIYTVYLNNDGYKFAYNTNNAYFDSITWYPKENDYVKIYVTVEDGLITAIEGDLTYIINDGLYNTNAITFSEYTFKYTITNHNDVEEIIIPTEAQDLKD